MDFFSSGRPWSVNAPLDENLKGPMK